MPLLKVTHAKTMHRPVGQASLFVNFLLRPLKCLTATDRLNIILHVEVCQQQLAESILPPEAKQIISSKAGAFLDFGPVIKSDDSHVSSKSKKGHSSGESDKIQPAQTAAAAGSKK